MDNTIHRFWSGDVFFVCAGANNVVTSQEVISKRDGVISKRLFGYC